MIGTAAISAARFEELVRAHYGSVYLVAYARLANRELAEDAAQEAFLRAFVCLDRLTDASAFAPWVCRIARNIAIDWLRSPAHRVRLLASAGLEEMAMPDTKTKSPREHASDSEQRGQAVRILEKLPAEMREVVLLHYAEELNLREIGERLGLHPTTVSYRLGKALGQCRELAGSKGIMQAEIAPGKAAAARVVTSVGAVGLLSAASRNVLAAKAATLVPSVPAAANAPAAKLSVLLLKPLLFAPYAGGIIMGSKQVALAVGAVALLGSGGGYLAVKHHKEVIAQAPIVIGPVTIKPSTPQSRRMLGNVLKDGSTNFSGATLEEVVAWTNHAEQINTVADPTIRKDKFDIILKKNSDYKAVSDAICTAFHLKVHKEKQERDVLVLTAPSGRTHALKAPTESPSNWFTDDPNNHGHANEFRTTSNDIRQLSVLIEETLKKKVFDETGLKDNYDYSFSWAGVKDDYGMIKAVGDQLGLKLEPARRPVDILFIEKAG